MSINNRIRIAAAAASLPLVAGAAMLTGVSAANADTGLTLPTSFNVTGQSPNVSAGGGFGSVSGTGTVRFGYGITQPANSCRTGLPAACPTGYPDWQADMTISGLQAAGLSLPAGSSGSAGGCVVTSTTADSVTCHYSYLNNEHKSDGIVFQTTPGVTGPYPISVALNIYPTLQAHASTFSDCKSGGWANYGTWVLTPTDSTDTAYSAALSPTYKNQGSCVSEVARS